MHATFKKFSVRLTAVILTALLTYSNPAFSKEAVSLEQLFGIDDSAPAPRPAAPAPAAEAAPAPSGKSPLDTLQDLAKEPASPVTPPVAAPIVTPPAAAPAAPPPAAIIPEKPAAKPAAVQPKPKPAPQPRPAPKAQPKPKPAPKPVRKPTPKPVVKAPLPSELKDEDIWQQLEVASPPPPADAAPATMPSAILQQLQQQGDPNAAQYTINQQDAAPVPTPEEQALEPGGRRLIQPMPHREPGMVSPDSAQPPLLPSQALGGQTPAERKIEDFWPGKQDAQATSNVAEPVPTPGASPKTAPMAAAAPLPAVQPAEPIPGWLKEAISAEEQQRQANAAATQAAAAPAVALPPPPVPAPQQNVIPDPMAQAVNRAPDAAPVVVGSPEPMAIAPAYTGVAPTSLPGSGFADISGLPQSVIVRTLPFSSFQAGLSFIVTQELNSLAKAMQQKPNVKLELQGFSRPIQSNMRDITKSLAADRVRNVIEYLDTRGIDRKRLIANPIGVDRTGSGRAPDRVDVLLAE